MRGVWNIKFYKVSYQKNLYNNHTFVKIYVHIKAVIEKCTKMLREITKGELGREE